MSIWKQTCNYVSGTTLGIYVNPPFAIQFWRLYQQNHPCKCKFFADVLWRYLHTSYVYRGEVCNMMGLTFAAYRRISNAASRGLLPFMTEDGLFVANFMPKWAWEIISPTVRCVKRINPIIPRPSRFQKERGQQRRQHLPCRGGSVPVGAQWYPTLSPLQPRHRSYCHSPWWCSLFLLLLNSWWLSFQFPLFPTTSIHIYIRTLPNGILTWRASCFNVIHFGAFSLLNCSRLQNQPIEIQMKAMEERNTCRVLSNEN